MKNTFVLIISLSVLILFCSSLVLADPIIQSSEESTAEIQSSSTKETSSSTSERSSANLFVTNVNVTFKSIPTGAQIYINNFSRGNTPLQVFLSPGTHNIRVIKSPYPPFQFNITIKSGFRYTYTINFHSSSPTPLAQLKIADGYPQGNNVVLICQASRGSGNYKYSWIFGDGEIVNMTNSSSITHHYVNNGTYLAKCLVHDIITGKTAQAQKSITVPAMPPTSGSNSGLIRIDTDGGLNAEFSCKPSGSTNNLIVYWNFGDGTVMEDSSSVESHTYQNPGNYIVRCKAEDSERRRTTSFSRIFSISGSGNPQNNTNNTNTANVNLRVSNSYPEGLNVVWICDSNSSSVSQYNFNFGDGKSATSDTKGFYHTYMQAGNYTAKCTIKNSYGQTLGQDTETVTVSN